MSKDRPAGRTARIIAITITVSIMVGTLFVIVAPYFRQAFDADGMAVSLIDKEVLQIIFPLWGTWIGTVLAFYFGKTNFEVATNSYEAVIKKLTPNEEMAKLYVKDKMIPFEKMAYLEYEAVKENTITAILDDENFKGFNRYPVFDKGTVKCIIHRGLFYKFIHLKIQEDKETSEIKELKLIDLVETTDSWIREMLEKSVAVVSLNATLLDAKNAIDNTPECIDVFVTNSGRKDEQVLGMITNSMILKEATV